MIDELNVICKELERYSFINIPSKLVNFYEGETILKDDEEVGGIYKQMSTKMETFLFII